MSQGTSGTCAGCTGCSGCSGVRTVTPRQLFQRPQLPALSARIGTHGDFFATMQARLSSRAALDGLTVRTLDDPSIAMLDCWAIVADTVTFYEERALNEGYLGTARQADSVARLGKLVGYLPRPALGSSGHLAFTMDPGQAGTVPAGTSAKSVPGPGEQPQTFETSEELEARAEWNQLEVRTTRPLAISPGTVDVIEELTFVGSSLNLKAGDLLVLDFGGAQPSALRDIASVTPDFQADRTVVTLVAKQGSPVGVDGALAVVRDRAKTAEAVAKTPVQTELGGLVRAAADELGGAPDALLPALATLIRLVNEAQALAAGGRLSTPDATWVQKLLTPIEEAARAATPLVSAFTRGRSPELDYLDRLAQAISCPDPGVRRVSPDCATGVPLLATAVALRALRRPPARPPESASAAPQSLASGLSPRSEALRELLAGSDPQLRAALTTATASLAVAGPRSTASVVALRTRANPVPEGLNNGFAVSVDGRPENLVPGGWIVSRELQPNDDVRRVEVTQLVTRIVDVHHAMREVGPPDAKNKTKVPTTIAVTAGEVLRDNGDVWLDAVTLWFGDQPLTLAEEPMLEPVGGGEISLAKPYPGLRPGRLIVVSGERSDVPGVTGVVASEVTMVGALEQRVDLDLPGDVTLPVLVLAVPLAYEYVRSSVTIRANVVGATQGESRSDVLGSGQAGHPNQSFTLKQPTVQAPLTHVPSVSASGEATTLKVRVDGVRWHPAEVLADAGPRDHAYAVEEGPPPTVAVRFGDGVHGSRLDNGIENVTASYRVGAGPSGNVGQDRVRQLTSRPLGVSAVANPLPMTGGTRRDSADDARTIAPLRTLALDRLVSVADYADFAVAHAGVAKASATRVHDGSREVVQLTVAAVDDAPLAQGDDLLTSLERTLAAYGDPHLPIQVDVRQMVRLVLSAGLKVDPDHLFDDVASRVRARLLDELGFRLARLGEPAHLSRVVAVVQNTPGVDYVKVDAFGGLSEVADPIRLLTEVTNLSGVADVVPARRARIVRREYVVGDDPTGDPDTLSTIALRHGLSLDELVELNPVLRGVTLTDDTTLVVEDGVAPAELACFDPAQPQTIVVRSIP